MISNTLQKLHSKSL